MSATLESPPELELPELPQESQPSEETSSNASAVIDRETILATFGPHNLKLRNVSWTVLVWMGLIHIGALAAPFYFTWQAAGVALLLHWFTCSIGICLCYHRGLSHRSFKLHGPAKVLGLYAAALAGEGSPLRWSMVHRIHHGHSDEPGDPHSPLEGKWWSHLLWMFVHQDREIELAAHQQYVPDLMKDRTVMFFERFWFPILIASSVALYAWGGLPMLLWGVCLRMTLAYHSTWFVNSATHLWGYRNYETTDASRNLWWVAVLSYGEGWHNNHHMDPASASVQHRWWEIDLTFYHILLLERLGLATDVIRPHVTRG
ncbi:MAG: fatty acid desaturase [Planctomycetaceae bacterium]|nr:fatty acid desaturase [Planctomycetaceae bacterium]